LYIAAIMFLFYWK